MLVIVSDLHLTDGTSGQAIKESAFRLFVERVRDLAFDASWRSGGTYRPVERVDILLLGDILDVMRSTAWLKSEKSPRPWSDPANVDYIGRVNDITDAILAYNESSLTYLRNLAEPGGLVLPPPGGPKGEPRMSAPGLAVEVGIHYMVGNHDWFYHLPNATFHRLRRKVVHALGLENDPEERFPHGPDESARLASIMRVHGVRACHGDVFDPYNYSGSRSESSLGDLIVVELLNRFPVEVRAHLGSLLPQSFIHGLRELDNVRPLAAVPVWIDALLREHSVSRMQARRVKDSWNDLVDDLISQDVIRERDSFYNPFESVDRLVYALRFTKGIPLDMASALGVWWNNRKGGLEESYLRHAVRETKTVDPETRFVVYGHTHRHEMVPLDAFTRSGQRFERIYFNAGTWRRMHRLTDASQEEHSFISFDVMTYLAFFKDDERGGRPYACWSGVLGDTRK